jgi:mRNA-degrading endonuclease RelE of RelBE toxin-antitoxin system
MSNNNEVWEIELLDDFQKEVKRFVSKKKFFKLPDQIDGIMKDFEKGNFSGSHITHSDTPTSYDVYKLRLPNEDTKSGKSNGYRVIYLVLQEKKLSVFLTIYYKKEKETISDEYVTGLIQGYFLGGF